MVPDASLAHVEDEPPARHSSSSRATKDAGEAYARFPEPEPMRYRDGWLPG
jgi:hypothetical protein